MPALVEKMDFPREETHLVWACLRCNNNHRWLIPPGSSVNDTARQSFTFSRAYRKRSKRPDVYERLAAASPELHRNILLGELIWWWREEAGLQQNEAAKAARITPRQWQRIEDAESKPRTDNLKRMVRAIHGSMTEANLLAGPNQTWGQDFERLIADLKRRIKKDSKFEIKPLGWTLQPELDEDVALAIGEFERALGDPDEDRFLFFVHSIHQAFYARLLGGPIEIDDNKSKIIPAVKKLIDILERCESKRAQYRVIYEMARGAQMFLTKPAVADFVTYFLRSFFQMLTYEDEIDRRIEAEWKKLFPMQKLILTLFDLVDSQDQLVLIKALRELHHSPRKRAK